VIRDSMREPVKRKSKSARFYPPITIHDSRITLLELSSAATKVKLL
jgi:hypothetical protein